MKYAAHLYRERGAVIEAMQLTGTPPDGTNIEEVLAWMREGWMREGNTPGKGLPEVYVDAGDDVVIRLHSSLRETTDARVGDWVVKHRNHVFSVVSDDEFDILYEVVE